MSFLSKVSIKSKLLLMLLGVSLTSILIVGFLALRTADRALQQSIEDRMTSIRSIKADQITTYFEGFASLTRTLGEGSGIANAARNLIFAYREGAEQPLTPEQQQQVTDFYEREFMPQLAENSDERPLTFLYRPRTPAANYFQYHYIANNPYPSDQKSELLVAEEDVTTYKRLHQANHVNFLKLRDEYGFGDLFLIDIESGNIVYSTKKNPDFATSLYDGPYRNSGLASLAARIRDDPKRGVLQSIDYRPYEPALNEPTAFFGIPLFSGNEAFGILAIQLPAEQIDDVMTGGGMWVEDGLGATGESYLVAQDRLMRSVSRFYLEDKEAYLENAQASGLPKKTVEAMRRYSTVLLQPIDTEATRRALAGESGTTIIKDYRGFESLTSFAPLVLGGQSWAILTEIDVTEAFAPIHELERTMLIWSVGLMLVVAFLAILLAQYFVQPIDKLADAANRIAAGEDGVHIEIGSNDEFGDLARNFNSMADSIHDQKAAIAETNAENERLLLNILPAAIAERLRAGERIADTLQQVSVVFIHMLGFSKLSEHWSAAESAAVLEQLIDMLDEAAGAFDVERVKTVGETYIAACGLTTARLDHANQCVAFAIRALSISQRLDQEHAQQLALQIGVNAGPVVSGVVGTARFNYELWGETVETTDHLHTQAKPNGLLITENVYLRIDRQSDFKLISPSVDSAADRPIYEYVGPTTDSVPNSAGEGEEA